MKPRESFGDVGNASKILTRKSTAIILPNLSRAEMRRYLIAWSLCEWMIWYWASLHQPWWCYSLTAEVSDHTNIDFFSINTSILLCSALLWSILIHSIYPTRSFIYLPTYLPIKLPDRLISSAQSDFMWWCFFFLLFLPVSLFFLNDKSQLASWLEYTRILWELLAVMLKHLSWGDSKTRLSITSLSPHLTRTLNKIMCLTLESLDYVLFLLLAIYLVILKVR